MTGEPDKPGVHAPAPYRIYLLTTWAERGQAPEQPLVWRFRLEEPRTGRQRGFSDLAALVAALEQEMVEMIDQGEINDSK